MQNNLKKTHKIFVTRLAGLLIDKIIIGHWGYQEVLSALLILRDLCYLHPKLAEIDENIAAKVVSTTCKFIELKFFSKVTTVEDESLILNAYEVCLSWILTDQWILKFPQTLKNILVVVENGWKIQPTDNSLHIGRKIKSASKYFYDALLHLFAHFPLASGPTLSSLRTEAGLLEAHKGMDKSSLSTIGINNHFLSVIRFPRSTGTELYCVTRDDLSRSIWRNKLNYFIEPVIYHPPVTAGTITPCDIPTRVSIDEIREELWNNMTEEDKEFHQQTFQRVIEATEREKQVLESRNYGIDVDCSIQPSKSITDLGRNDPTIARLFFTTFALNYLENSNNFANIKLQFSPNQDILNFKPLDNTAPQHCYSAGIIYFSKEEPQVIKVHNKPSKDYLDFIWSIGWKIDVNTHTGYLGGLNSNITPNAPYYSNYNLELIFHCLSIQSVPSAKTSLNFMKRLIFSDQVVICWVEDLLNFERSLFDNEFQVIIVIHPQPTKLYRIKIFRSPNSNVFGPLQNDMVVSKQVLATVTRMTVLNACKISTNLSEPMVHRMETISSIEKDYTSQNSVYKYYLSQII